MTTILAYAVAVLLNMGVITSSDVNRTTNNLRVVERDGKTVVIDSATGVEIIVYA